MPEARWLSLTRLGPRHIPVVGPTEALPGRPGGPGISGPRGAVPGGLGQARKSGWQLAHQAWRDAGVEWEAATATFKPELYEPGPYDQNLPEPTAYGPDPYQPGPYEPDPDEPQSPELDPDEPGSRPGDKYRDLLSPDERAAAVLPVLREPADSRFGMGPWPAQQPAAVTAPQPVLAPPPPVPAPRPPEPAPRPPEPAQRPVAPMRRMPSAFPPPSAFAAPGAFGAPPPHASPRLTAPLGAPVGAPPRNAQRGAPTASAPPSAPPAPAAPPLGEPDELFRAWQGSVRQATARRDSWPAPRPAGTRPASAGARRGRGWQAARIGVPAAVIVTVGAGALLMLTGRANDMLAQRASTGTLSSAAAGVSASLGSAGQPGATLTGYPGGHGAVTVTALWSAGDTILAVGYADGHPAVWRHAVGGAWSLVSPTMFGGLTGHLTSVAHGPAGWVAVGSAIEGGAAEPVAFWSADGVTWAPLPALTALARTDAQFLGVASGPGGYAVVGRQGTGAGSYASFWWSANLHDWASNANSGNTGSVAAAAVAVGNGFVAVGAAAHCHTVWTSPDGRQWTEHDLAKPSGATTATLRSVATGAGGRFVAAGFASAGAIDVPIVVTSAGAGAPLTQVVLGADGATATVTGVTATSRGFVAVGLAGPASERHAVEWTSPDGLTWSAAAPLASAGTSAITALTVTGGTAAGTAQRGAGPAMLTIPSR